MATTITQAIRQTDSVLAEIVRKIEELRKIRKTLQNSKESTR